MQQKQGDSTNSAEVDNDSIKKIVCSSSLPLAGTSCVRSTLLNLCLQALHCSKKQHCQLTLATLTIFFSENQSSLKKLGKQGIEPGVAGSRSVRAKHCAMPPQNKFCFSLNILSLSSFLFSLESFQPKQLVNPKNIFYFFQSTGGGFKIDSFLMSQTHPNQLGSS